MNIFDAARNKDKLEDSFDKVKCNLHLISFEDDMLFFPEEMEEIRDIIENLGADKEKPPVDPHSTIGLRN